MLSRSCKNHPEWRGNMEPMLLTLRQCGMVDGSPVRPVPADPDNITPQETVTIAELAVSAYQEIKLRISANANSVLGRSRDSKTVWDILERRFGSRQEGLQAALVKNLQQAAWGGKGSILEHRDFMFDLRAQLNSTGLVLSDQSFRCYFTQSLPPSLDVFIMFHDDVLHDVDLLCERFVR